MRNFRVMGMACILILIFAMTAFSQIIIEEESSSNGFRGMMAFKSTNTTELTPTAKRQVSETKFTGSFMKHFNSNNASVEITRLDKEVIWNLDTKKKTYTEFSFAQFKEMMSQGMEQPEMPAQAESEEVDESEYEWEKPVVIVIPGEGNEKINGFKCKNYIVKVITVGKHKQTGIKDTMTVISDMWNTTADAKALTMLKEFQQNMMTKLGMDQSMKGMGQMMAAYGEYFKELSKETAKIEGYSIRTTTRMTSTTHVQAAQKKDAPKEEEAEGTDVDLNKNPVGGLLGGFAKKMARKKMAAKKESDTGAEKELFQFTNEIKSIKMADFAAGTFDIPADYKKTESPMMQMPKE